MLSKLDEIRQRIEAHCVKWPQAAYGPGHIVLSDYNLETGHIEWCLRHFLDEASARGAANEQEDKESVELLNWLLTIPENVRVPDDSCQCPTCANGAAVEFTGQSINLPGLIITMEQVDWGTGEQPDKAKEN